MQPPAPLPKVPPRGIPLERILWHPFDILIAIFLSEGLIYTVVATAGFDPLSAPISGLLLGMGSGIIASIYYQLVWGVECPFCKVTTPTETGRCAVCLAPLDADPETFRWEVPPHLKRPGERPGPHGDKGTFRRSRMRWQGNEGILAREAMVFFAEVVLVGLTFEHLFYDATVGRAAGPLLPLSYFGAAFAIAIFRPAMHRFARRVAASWKARPKPASP
jgi:hypothetical protein